MRGIWPFIKDAWRLAKPYYSAESEERWSARGLLVLYASLKFGAVGINVLFSYWSNAWFTSIQEKDWDTFINLLLLGKHLPTGLMPGFVLFASLAISMLVLRQWIAQLLQIRWRRWLTARLLDRWLADRAYYRISLASAANGSATYTDNPDQRIAEDVRDFIGDSVTNSGSLNGVLALTVDLISNIITFVSFMAILWSLSGPMTVFGVAVPGYLVWVALIYSVVGTALTHLVGRKLVPLSFRKQRVEADFRFGLVRVRENAEGIALYGGEVEEKRGLLDRFAVLVMNWRALMTRQAYLNMLTSFYGQVGGIFPYIAASPAYFAGRITFGALQQTAQSFGEVQGALSWVVDRYEILATWRATVERLTTFLRAIEVARASSFDSGGVQRPAGTSLFLPQRPYIPLGTLRHAVAYPEAVSEFSDAEVRAVIESAGLAHLLPRLDDEDLWSQRLSGGEQQRLALARALLVKPDWLFLDEATASLDPEGEAALYMAIRKHLPHTTVVSIAHRPALADFHDRHLVVERGAAGPGRLVETPAEAVE
jgi:putative ATP-binding cassette transporter